MDLEHPVYYHASGPMRGSCGHEHDSIKEAYECIQKDHEACRACGEVSDRKVARCDGAELDDQEYDWLDEAIERWGKPEDDLEEMLSEDELQSIADDMEDEPDPHDSFYGLD